MAVVHEVVCAHHAVQVPGLSPLHDLFQAFIVQGFQHGAVTCAQVVLQVIQVNIVKVQVIIY